MHYAVELFYATAMTAFGESASGVPSLPELVGAGDAAFGASRYEEAIACFDDAVARFGLNRDPEGRRHVAYALLKKADALRSLGLLEDSLAVCDQLVREFRVEGGDYLRTLVLLAFDRKARALADMGRPEDQLVSREAELAFLEEDGVPQGQPLAQATARAGRAIALSRLGRGAEAIADWGEVLSVVHDATTPLARVREAQALMFRARELHRRGDYQGALADVEQLLARFPPGESPYMSRKVAEALLEQARIRRETGLSGLAAPTLVRLTTEFVDDADPEVERIVAEALFWRGEDFYSAGDLDGAERMYDQVLERVRKASSGLAWEAAGAAVGKAWVLGSRGVLDEALMTLDVWLNELNRRFPDDAANRVRIAYAKMSLLDWGGRYEDAVQVADGIIETFNDSSDPRVRVNVAAALLEKATAPGLDRLEEATTAFETLGEEYATEALEIIDAQIGRVDVQAHPLAIRRQASLRLGRAYMLSYLNRHNNAGDELEALIREVGESDDPGVLLVVALAREAREEIDGLE